MMPHNQNVRTSNYLEVDLLTGAMYSIGDDFNEIRHNLLFLEEEVVPVAVYNHLQEDPQALNNNAFSFCLL